MGSDSGALGVTGDLLRRAEELILRLAGVVSVRIVPGLAGAIDEVHVLTTDRVHPKHTVRNIESALMAHLGIRVNHKKISVATTRDLVPEESGGDAVSQPRVGASARESGYGAGSGSEFASESMPESVKELFGSRPHARLEDRAGVESRGDRDIREARDSRDSRGVRDTREADSSVLHAHLGAIPGGLSRPVGSGASAAGGVQRVQSSEQVAVPIGGMAGRRTVVFRDVEVRQSRTRGVTCVVTLSREGEDHVGEANSHDRDGTRLELSALAAVSAIRSVRGLSPSSDSSLVLDGVTQIDLMGRTYIFVSVSVRTSREPLMLAGSCEVRGDADTSAVLAVLDATNRWMQTDR